MNGLKMVRIVEQGSLDVDYKVIYLSYLSRLLCHWEKQKWRIILIAMEVIVFIFLMGICGFLVEAFRI